MAFPTSVNDQITDVVSDASTTGMTTPESVTITPVGVTTYQLQPDESPTPQIDTAVEASDGDSQEA